MTDASPPWELVLTWKAGHQTRFPAATRGHALQQQTKISLRPELHQRLEVVSNDLAQALWDVSWPCSEPSHILNLPPDLLPEFREKLLFQMRRERAMT